jgi:bifunctional UDP-N-acetylglucosamine pyrophosphorylase / glucosamine-1-phosphate N-acetyltransferase
MNHPTQTSGTSTLGVVILAAGQGKRMKSAKPKVLHQIAGQSMLAHVIAAAKALSPGNITIVYGHGGDQVRAAFDDNAALTWAKQEPQLGTGHAVLQAMPALADAQTATTLILYGDVPLIASDTLAKQMRSHG